MAKDFNELVQDLEDERWEVRQDAAISLGRLGDVRAVEPLIAALGDESGDVREAVAEALGELGDVHAVEPLIAVLRDDDSRVHVAVAKALQRLIQGIETLINNMDGSNEEKPTILIVEDDLDTSDMLRVYFEAQGYEVLTARWIEDQVSEARIAQPEPSILPDVPPSDERQSLQQELAARKRNLHKLREQAAVFAVGDTPLRLLNQIEAEETAIQIIREQLDKLSQSTV